MCFSLLFFSLVYTELPWIDIFLCIFVCLWTVQISGLYGEFIEEISTGHDFGR